MVDHPFNPTIMSRFVINVRCDFNANLLRTFNLTILILFEIMVRSNNFSRVGLDFIVNYGFIIVMNLTMNQDVT